MVSTMGIETAIIGSSLLGATQARKAGKRAEKAAEKEAADKIAAEKKASAKALKDLEVGKVQKALQGRRPTLLKSTGAGLRRGHIARLQSGKRFPR